MNELHFARAFDQSPVGMAFLQDDGQILSANPALAAMLQKDLWLVVGSTFADHLSPEEGLRWSQFFDRFRGSSVYGDSFESAYVPAGGRPSWWTVHLSDLALDWSGGKTYFAVLQDVTERRAAEQRATEARALAEGASRAKSEFLANMSHEIRTPLFTITGMTDLLRLGDLRRDQAHHAGQIATAAQHLLELVNDILDFSKIEAGQMSLESIPLDLDEVVGRSLEVVSLSAYRKGLELVLDIEPSLPRQWVGDPGRLRQILVNLLANAVKFTHHGRVVLSVGPGPTFRVKDTGIGISPESRGRLFQVFSQADSSTTRQYGGTGLGLAISQKLVHLSGGVLDFTSVPGRGTEFWFTLPLPPAVSTASPGTPAADTVPAGTPILVADDDPVVRELLEKRLTEAGFAVTAAADRASALDSLGRLRPAVVLIDQELGTEDGWQLASEIRANPATADLPLVLMSLLRKSLEPSPRYPADLFRCFVDKPINPRGLIRTLRRGLEGRWTEVPEGPVAGSLLDRALLKRSADRMRILVAEDHEVNRELFRLLLRSLGHQVVLVENGREACEIGLSSRPHLVFMDLQMPEMNGYEAARQLRRQGLVCPIVAVTASAVKGELERCREAGMNGILTKPFNLDTLAAVVRSYAPRGIEKTWTAPAAGSQAAEGSGQDQGPVDAFHPDEALRTFLGNRDLLDRLLAQFIEKGRAAVAELAELAQQGDLAGLQAAAHKLKGSAANLTARPLARAAQALELAAAEGRGENAPALAAAVGQSFDHFAAAVVSYSTPASFSPK